MELPDIVKYHDARSIYDQLFAELYARIEVKPIKMRSDEIDFYTLFLYTAMWHGVQLSPADIVMSTSNDQCYVINEKITTLEEMYSYSNEKYDRFGIYYVDDLVWMNTNNKRVVSLSSARMNLLILMNKLYKLFTDPEPHLDFEYSILCKSPADLEAKAKDDGWLK